MTDSPFDNLIYTIKSKMHDLESYVMQERGGIGSVEGLMGFDTARDMLLAKSPIYRIYEDLLTSAGVAY
jgi:hypothetical protein